MYDKFIYIYDNLKNPGEGIAFTSLRQLAVKIGKTEKQVRRYLSGGLYCDPLGGFRLMKVYLERDGRRKNGDSGRLIRGKVSSL